MNLIKSTGTFSFFTIISRILGYLRDILIAIFLGAGPLADAFFVAFRIPNTFRRLFAEGTFNAAFVPSYASELTDGKENGDKFANNIFSLLIFILFSLVLLIELIMPFFVYLIAPGFSEDESKLDLAIILTRITFPFLFFVSLSSFFAGILNTHNKFAAAAAAPIILNIFLISVLLYGNYLGDKLVYFLSYATTLAGLIQLIYLYIYVKKFYVPKIKFKFLINDKIKAFFSRLLPSIFSSGVTQINILIGTIIASFQASAVSYLYYADRIYQINLAIAGIAIGTVILPKLSKFVNENQSKEILFLQNKAVELSLFLSIPASIAILIGSDEIISALFGYGSFGEKETKNTSDALFYFSIGLPAFSIIKVFSSFYFARKNTKTPFYISLFSVIVNVSISLTFFQSIGFIIIPIATTLSSWLNCILLFIFLNKDNLFNFNSMFYNRLSRILFSAIAMGFFYNYLLEFFSNNLAFEENLKALYLIGIVFIGLISYLIIAIFVRAFKISDINLKY